MVWPFLIAAELGFNSKKELSTFTRTGPVVSDEKEKDVNDFGLGMSVPLPIRLPHIVRKGGGAPKGGVDDNVQQDTLEAYRAKVDATLAGCSTKRDVLETEVDSLATCVALAAEIYKDAPIPDNAYQLSALTNAHNSALSQLEKMKDPQVILSDLEKHIRDMFTNMIQALIGEIHKTKHEFNRTRPEDKATVEDQFSRMLDAIQPQTQVLYDGLQEKLKSILGIKK